MNPNTHQTSHDRLLEALRGVLLAAVQAGPSAQVGIDSILHRAGATLYSLLVDHGVDQRGRCRSCRRPGAVVGLRRRPCRVRGKAEVWLRLPAEVLQSFLASELGLTPVPPARTSGTPAVASERGGTFTGVRT